jgi:acyl-CoA reductase-like NAD-dependent aldehyde dehydrogenase
MRKTKMSEPKIFPMTIDGASVAGQKFMTITNPSTGADVGRAPLCTPDDLDAAVIAANRAQAAWALVSDEDRRAMCSKISETITEHSTELSRLLTLEQGKPLKGMGSEFEIGGAAAWAGYAATLEMPVKIIQDDKQSRIEQHRVPIGVVGSITPWNWPVMIAIWHIVPALRAGNAVIIKPSEYTPLSTLRMVEILNTILPKGLLNCVTGSGNIGALMSSHEGINKIVFTGSTATGKRVMQNAAGNLKRLTLELGGNDAGIVLDDCKPAEIAEGIFWGAFINSGQTCAALKRLYVPDSIYDEVCAELVKIAQNTSMGDGLDELNVLGPLQNKMQFEKVSELVEDAKRSGARILCGGEKTSETGYFFPITLVADIKAGARLVEEEQFGTALPIIKYTNLDAVIKEANNSEFGLAASVWSTNLERARAVATQLVAGSIFINKHGDIAPHVPFGGVKSSGIGVEFGIEGLEANTDIKIYNVAK